MGSDMLGRASMGPDMAMDFQDHTLDDYQLDDIPGGIDMDMRGKSLSPLSRLSTPGADGQLLDDGDETYADASCPIATFDVRPMTQTQGTERENDGVDTEGKGYSKNTVKALGIIRHELKPADGDDDEEKVLSYRQMADKVCSPPYTVWLA
jgi:cohesin complex subunit SCC1